MIHRTRKMASKTIMQNRAVATMAAAVAVRGGNSDNSKFWIDPFFKRVVEG